LNLEHLNRRKALNEAPVLSEGEGSRRKAVERVKRVEQFFLILA
jgi:hypothetical protein